MNIGMGIPTLGFHGGIERHAHDLAGSLARRGHTLTLLHGPARGRDVEAFTAPFAAVRPLADPRAGEGLDVAYVHKATELAELAALRALPVAIAAHDHDLTCVRRHRYLPIGNAPCHLAPGIQCVTHGCVVVRDRRPDAPLPLRLESPFSLRHRLRELAWRAPLVACSAYVAEGLVAAGVAPSRVRVIHPIPPEIEAPLVARPRAPRLLAVGQLIRGKGFDLAVDALAHLPGAVTLTLAGDGPDRPALEARAHRVAPGRVHFAGYVTPAAIEALYDAASVILVPSRWPEPFGMVGVEAMRRGRPVVGAEHGGIPEWLAPESGGLLVPPGDPAALARAALALLADDQAGERAAAHVRARFTHERTVGAVEQLLAELCPTLRAAA